MNTAKRKPEYMLEKEVTIPVSRVNWKVVVIAISILVLTLFCGCAANNMEETYELANQKTEEFLESFAEKDYDSMFAMLLPETQRRDEFEQAIDELEAYCSIQKPYSLSMLQWDVYKKTGAKEENVIVMYNLETCGMEYYVTVEYIIKDSEQGFSRFTLVSQEDYLLAQGQND